MSRFTEFLKRLYDSFKCRLFGLALLRAKIAFLCLILIMMALVIHEQAIDPVIFILKNFPVTEHDELGGAGVTKKNYFSKKVTLR